MTLEQMEHEWGPLMFTKCCRYWPIHAAFLITSIGRCHICKCQMEVVTDEQEVQRLRLTAAKLAEGPGVRPTGREPYLGFLKRYFEWLFRGQDGPIPQRQNGGGDTAGPGGSWALG